RNLPEEPIVGVEEGTDLFIRELREELSQVDDIVQVVLNGHARVEVNLDDVLEKIFYDPERLEEANLSFMQKVHIARASTLNTADVAQWHLSVALNVLRNRAVHRRKDGDVTKNFNEIRAMLLGMGTEKFGEDVRTAGAKDLIVYTAAMCTGLLAVLEDH